MNYPNLLRRYLATLLDFMQMDMSEWHPSVSTVLLLILATPAMAIVIRHDRDDSRYQQFASGYSQVVHMNLEQPGKPPDGEGTLIATTWVVTAAHVATLVEPGHRVTVGSREYPVAAVHIHPEWEDGPHDIALVRLAEPVTGITPVRLYRQQDEVGKIVVVAGTGDTGDGRTGPTHNDRRLRAATNRIDVASDLWLKFTFDQGETATDLEGISGPGDSGGPAFLDQDGERYLVGVGSGQSTRATGGREGLYGVTEYYTRVSTHLEWLDSVTGTGLDASDSKKKEVNNDGELCTRSCHRRIRIPRPVCRNAG